MYRSRGTSQRSYVTTFATNSSDVPQSRQSDFRSRVSGQVLQGKRCHWGYGMVEWAVPVSCSLVYSRCNRVCDSLTHESLCAHSEYQQQQQQQLQSTANRSMSKLLISKSDFFVSIEPTHQYIISRTCQLWYWLFPHGPGRHNWSVGVNVSNFPQGKIGLYK